SSQQHPALQSLLSFPTRRSSDLVSHFRGESEKKLFAGREYFCGVSRHSRVWGRHSPTSFPRGTKPQNCGFWHRGRNLLSVTANLDRKSTRLNSSHVSISYAVFCL